MEINVNRLEEKIHGLIDKHLFYIGVAVLIVISFLIRWHMAPICVLSADYNNFLVPWFEHYKEVGLAGLAAQVGDYYVPYNLFLALISYLPWPPWVMISLFSFLFDYISAFFIYRIGLLLLEEAEPAAGGSHSARAIAVLAGTASLFLPFTFLNSALWKQCDGIYACFMIISLYYILKERYKAALILLGIGFCVKLQAIFLLPVFVLLYIAGKKNLKLRHFFYFPLMYLLGGIPAVAAGRRITNIYGTYYRQMNHEGYNAMTIHFPNLYGIGLSDYPALQMPFTLITMGIFIFFACSLQRYLKSLNRKMLVYIVLWCVWTCTMFLPGMHERYNYAVVLLASGYYLIADRKKLWVAVVLNLISIVLYSSYLFGMSSFSLPVLSIFHIVAYGYATYDLVHQITLCNQPD